MVTREAIVKAARSWLGTPYHHQASLKGAGADCLGLIRGIWRELYGPEPEAMPAYTRDWGDATGAETLLAAAGAISSRSATSPPRAKATCSCSACANKAWRNTRGF
jgi:NlpC/P60 family putative phage cell wall peptidase